MSGVEGLAYACCFVIAYTGRKVPTVGSYLAGGCSLLISIIIQLYAPETLARARAITALSVVGKFCISAAWQIIFVWQSEVYPTTHRCMLTSLNGVVGRIGTVLAPYMVDLHKYINVPNEDIILPSLFVVLMVGVGLMHIIPPETNKRKLPVNLHEANKSSFPFAGEQDELRSTFKEDGLLQTTKI
ncbi:hypothetical protein EB796_008070 [Bugula neritina]|uniref:Major facilitator superfamily (MFS) profile domain-containing protein n=1 Tax=Bugula neritina TaxID=10212 RepID=A0A7J7K5U9_BUGNE|nr:hypothetical protein EB796_008070 [Bugula neritina]